MVTEDAFSAPVVMAGERVFTLVIVELADNG